MRITDAKYTPNTNETMHINYADGDFTEISSIDVEPTGDECKTVEKAVQRFFSGDVAKYRACLIAADVADCNRSHPHYGKYKRLAENMTVETKKVDHWNGRVSDDFQVTRVIIEDNN